MKQQQHHPSPCCHVLGGGGGGRGVEEGGGGETQNCCLRCLCLGVINVGVTPSGTDDKSLVVKGPFHLIDSLPVMHRLLPGFPFCMIYRS